VMARTTTKSGYGLLASFDKFSLWLTPCVRWLIFIDGIQEFPEGNEESKYISFVCPALDNPPPSADQLVEVIHLANSTGVCFISQI
jgi:hypothetical protein